MSRMRETEPEKPRPGRTDGANREAFTARLQMILRQWPSTDRLARAMGVSPSAFRKWLRGEAEPSRERLIALADAAKVGIAWLARGEGPAPTFPQNEDGGRRRPAEAGAESDTGPFLLLPRRPDGVAAGVGPAPPPSMETGYIGFRHDWVRSTLGLEPKDVIMESAVGESMVPSIRHGDLLLVDTTDRGISSFGIYVLEIGGERLVKRVQRKLDGSLVLISDNPTYETDQVSGAMLQNVTVIGKVVWRGGAV
jgi:phage repressor protein C with HTH and peptisase S24 domain